MAPRCEILHGRVLVAALHLAVDEADLIAEEFAQILRPVLRGGEIGLLAALDQRADPIDLCAGLDRPAESGHHFVDALDIDRPCVDPLASGRLFPQGREVHVAEIGQRQRARDRRRGHGQHVDGLAFFAKSEALVDAETVLLVDHREAETGENDIVLNQSMGADDNDPARRSPGPLASRAVRRPCRGRSSKRGAGRRRAASGAMVAKC